MLLRQPITVRLRNVTLERALQEIASRAGVSLLYSRAARRDSRQRSLYWWCSRGLSVLKELDSR